MQTLSEGAGFRDTNLTATAEKAALLGSTALGVRLNIL